MVSVTGSQEPSARLVDAGEVDLVTEGEGVESEDAGDSPPIDDEGFEAELLDEAGVAETALLDLEPDVPALDEDVEVELAADPALVLVADDDDVVLPLGTTGSGAVTPFSVDFNGGGD